MERGARMRPGCSRQSAKQRPPQLEPQTAFEFVTQPDRSQVRRHVMKELWRKRKQANRSDYGRVRELAPRLLSTPTGVPGTGLVINLKAPITIGTSDENQEALIATSSENSHVLVEPDELDDWKASYIPSQHDREILFPSLSGCELDPFNSIKLSREDQGLLYHWANIYAYEAFGQPSDSLFSLMRDLYVPVDLSHAACVYGVLAHSASHIAFLRQEQISIQAIKHKMAAVHLVNEALSDPVLAVSDDNFSAVLRLLTFERYWGTEDVWRLHRKGLNQMIKLRGGLSTFSDNWQLEARIHLVSLMTTPKWNDAAFKTSEIILTDEMNEPRSSSLSSQIIQRPHSNFVNFFSNITLTHNITHRYPSIERATLLLQSLAEGLSGRAAVNRAFGIQETSRLMSLFYVAVISKDSLRSQSDLQWLDDFLAKTEQIWFNSVEMLRWLLLQVTGRGVKEPRSEQEIHRLRDIGDALKYSPWRNLDDRLMNVLPAGLEGGILEVMWSGDIFTEESST